MASSVLIALKADGFTPGYTALGPERSQSLREAYRGTVGFVDRMIA